MNARANVPSGFKNRAKFSINLRSGTFAGGCGCGAEAGVGFGCCFFGDDERKKFSIPPFDGGGFGRGATITGGAGIGGGGARALKCAIMCGSRRTLTVKVNSSFACSILVAPNRRER